MEDHQLVGAAVVQPLIEAGGGPDRVERVIRKFPYGADYIITLNLGRRALMSYYRSRLTNRLVDEPYTEVSSVSWLLIAIPVKDHPYSCFFSPRISFPISDLFGVSKYSIF